jgi:hypothetical protein
VQSAESAWAELVSGFSRGEGNGNGLTLAEESARMRQTHSYLHVYWSGAMFMLEADVALRERGSSLDQAIARGAQTWRGDLSAYGCERICAMWDGGLEVLEPLIAAYLARTSFPRAQPLLRRLGVSQRGIEPDAPLARIRDAIMETTN